MKTRLAIIYDVPGWAFHGEALAMQRCYLPGYDVDLIMSREATAERLRPYAAVYAMAYYGRGDDHPLCASSISSTSFFTRRDKRMDGYPEAMLRWGWIVVKNQWLWDRLTDEDHPRLRLHYHALDTTLWNPSGKSYQDRPGLLVGYAGHDRPLKGLHLIREAVEAIPGAELQTYLYTPEHRIPRESMPAWYRSLDVYVCASTPGQDCGPNPPMEAGLCGTPVVTTRVGQIGEMVVDGENGIVVERTVEAIRNALEQLRDVRERERLGRAAASSFLDRWATYEGQRYNDLFEEMLDHAETPDYP